MPTTFGTSIAGEAVVPKDAVAAALLDPSAEVSEVCGSGV
jgi:hypothetical protein